MEFPITDLLDHGSSVDWLLRHFHPKGLQCPDCRRPVSQAREFRRTHDSELVVYRCRGCDAVYNLYTGTTFERCPWTPRQVVMFMRGICKGETSRELAAELKMNYQTVLNMRHKVQANVEREQPNTPLPDSHSETDEMFQNAGEKR
jgi:transposase-like protein